MQKAIWKNFIWNNLKKITDSKVATYRKGKYMNVFGTIYRYELKKILQKKIVWITVIIGFIITVVTIVSNLFGYHYVNGVKSDSHYESFLQDREYERALNGRKIDQTLLEEMKAAYDKVEALINSPSELNSTGDKWINGNGVVVGAATSEAQITDEQRVVIDNAYKTIAQPYKAIYNFARGMTDMTTNDISKWRADEQDLYAKRSAYLEELWRESNLSNDEKLFWKQKEAEQKRPVIFHYAGGYEILFHAELTIGLFIMFAAAICLASIFTEEHARKTDQLILCSTQGKARLYWVKLLAGITFIVVVSLAVFGLAFLLAFCVYGIDGFSAPVQLVYPRCSWVLSIGQAILIIYGLLLLLVIFFSLCVMILSELLHSNIATLAAATAFLIGGMIINIPVQYRVISQLWDSLPNTFYFTWNIFDLRLIKLFGHYFTAWQVIPVFYMVIGIAIIFVGKPIYQRFQISGR